jgi:hypothetical protein
VAEQIRRHAVKQFLPPRFAVSGVFHHNQISGYAASHCMKCRYGWTRTGAKGSIAICLLDREPVLIDMIDCSRFELEDKKKNAPEIKQGEAD